MERFIRQSRSSSVFALRFLLLCFELVLVKTSRTHMPPQPRRPTEAPGTVLPPCLLPWPPKPARFRLQSRQTHAGNVCRADKGPASSSPYRPLTPSPAPGARLPAPRVLLGARSPIFCPHLLCAPLPPQRTGLSGTLGHTGSTNLPPAAVTRSTMLSAEQTPQCPRGPGPSGTRPAGGDPQLSPNSSPGPQTQEPFALGTPRAARPEPPRERGMPAEVRCCCASRGSPPTQDVAGTEPQAPLPGKREAARALRPQRCPGKGGCGSRWLHRAGCPHCPAVTDTFPQTAWH